MTGTNGVIRWTVGSADLVLSLMWVVPYNRQFYRSWVAVGLTSHTNLPTYKEMYSGKDDSRFTRRNAGQKFEFSTAGGKFIVIAEMDGDSTLKPVLRVSLIPKDESLLGSNIRYGIFSHFDSMSQWDSQYYRNISSMFIYSWWIYEKTSLISKLHAAFCCLE